MDNNKKPSEPVEEEHWAMEEVKKMENEKPVVNITVNIAGVQEATQLVERLCEKIKEAKTLAGDLTSLVESLEVNIHR